MAERWAAESAVEVAGTFLTGQVSLSEILCALSRLINDTPRTDRQTAVRTALWQTPIRAAAFSSLW